LRAIYDKYGDYGLKEGVVVDGKRTGGGYFLHVSPEVIFDRIFNSTDPWSEQPNLDGTDLRGSMFGDGFKGLNQKPAPKPHDVVVTLHCTLEEFYVGSVKNFDYIVDEVQHDGNTVVKVNKHSSVQVDPGFSEQTVLTFKGKGNQFPKLANSNLVIKFAQMENKHFKRNGDDLILTVSVSFVDCLNFKPVTVRTLDGRSLT
jgi:DnaJ-class molecular chaperone